ncbi:hypothetical protein [Bacillus phage vB_BanS-Thrax5]|nr:hypothetical protein [Bacillus phage vB_BanS-Thrax5]
MESSYYGVGILYYLTINYGGKSEFENIEGLFQDIIFSNSKIAMYKISGNSIKMTREFLDSTWKFKNTNKKFIDAYNYAITNNHTVLTRHGAIHSLSSGLSGIKLRDMIDISLKDLVETTMWDSIQESDIPIMSNGYGSGFAFEGDKLENPPTNVNYWSFHDAVNRLLQIQPPVPHIQFNTNRKVYIDNDGVKDYATNQLIEFEPSLYLNGSWYEEGTYPEEGGNPVEQPTLTDKTLLEAVAQVNWDTQYIVYKKYDNNARITINTKQKYEEYSLNQFLTYFHQGETLQSFVMDTNWEIVNR